MNKLTLLTQAARSYKLPMAVALCLGVVAGSCMLIAMPSEANTPAQQPVAALSVTVAPVTEAQWPQTLDASGAIAPWQEAVIGAQVSGLRLADIRVNVGDRVKRGQVLASFDADLLRADESRLLASWQQAEANRQRTSPLQGTGGISDQDLLQYITQANIAKAQLQSTQLQLRYATVIASDDGVISSRTAATGAVYASGQELFRLIRQSRLEWRGEMTAKQLAQIRPGQRVNLALPDGSAAMATVRQSAPSLNSETRLGIVYADIGYGSAARAGMYAQGKVMLAQSPAMVVPAASLVIRDGRTYVPTLKKDERIGLHAVVVGRRQHDQVEITSGLAAGDQVIVQGAGFLNDGDLVHVIVAKTKTKE